MNDDYAEWASTNSMKPGLKYHGQSLSTLTAYYNVFSYPSNVSIHEGVEGVFNLFRERSDPEGYRLLALTLASIAMSDFSRDRL